MLHAGEAPECSLAHPLTLHTDTLATPPPHTHTRPLAPGLLLLQPRGSAPTASCTGNPLTCWLRDEKLKLLPMFSGVGSGSQKLCGEPVPREGPLFFELCVLGLHECVHGGAASSRSPVGEDPPLRVLHPWPSQ